MSQDFEMSIVRGKAHWVTSIVHEPASARLAIWLTHDEDTFKPTRVIEFADVQKLKSQWTDRNDGTIEGLFGAHEEELAGVIRYLLVTDQREIQLDTRRTAVIHSAPFSTRIGEP